MILPTKYTGRRQNDFNIHAYVVGTIAWKGEGERRTLLYKYAQSHVGYGNAPTVPAARSRVTASPGRSSHSDTTLYISLVIIHTKYTGWRENGVNFYA